MVGAAVLGIAFAQDKKASVTHDANVANSSIFLLQARAARRAAKQLREQKGEKKPKKKKILKVTCLSPCLMGLTIHLADCL